MALLLIWIVSKVAPQYRFIQKTVDALNEAVEENLIAIRLVKSFVRADYETDRFDRVNEDLASLMQKTNHLAFLNLPLFQASMNITIPDHVLPSADHECLYHDVQYLPAADPFRGFDSSH